MQGKLPGTPWHMCAFVASLDLINAENLQIIDRSYSSRAQERACVTFTAINILQLPLKRNIHRNRQSGTKVAATAGSSTSEAPPLTGFFFADLCSCRSNCKPVITGLHALKRGRCLWGKICMQCARILACPQKRFLCSISMSGKNNLQMKSLQSNVHSRKSISHSLKKQSSMSVLTSHRRHMYQLPSERYGCQCSASRSISSGFGSACIQYRTMTARSRTRKCLSVDRPV